MSDFILVFLMAALFFWGLFLYAFKKDRSRYRNCYFLFAALSATVLFLLSLAGEHMAEAAVILVAVILITLLIVPFFLIFNGLVMIKKEGRHLSHLLSLGLGILVLVGEIATFLQVFDPYLNGMIPSEPSRLRSVVFVLTSCVSVSVIYGSMAFVIFMIYTLFLQIVPRKKDFDYVIIHGAGLIGGKKVSKLLQDRLDKAIEVYRKDPTPPKMIPSGGKGTDESVSEAEAMRDYLLSKGIPDEDIMLENASTTTFENLSYSQQILDRQPGRKYTALVTSNYHVYRALRYCKKIGLPCTGIGSRVAFYYWPNALIREFIAIHAEPKHAVIFFGGWLACLALILLPLVF